MAGALSHSSTIINRVWFPFLSLYCFSRIFRSKSRKEDVFPITNKGSSIFSLEPSSSTPDASLLSGSESDIPSSEPDIPSNSPLPFSCDASLWKLEQMLV